IRMVREQAQQFTTGVSARPGHGNAVPHKCPPYSALNLFRLLFWHCRRVGAQRLLFFEATKPPPKGGGFCCDPNGIRTRVTAVRGRRTRPLYDGAALPFKQPV